MGAVTLVQLLTAGGVAAFLTSITQMIISLRKSGPERESMRVGTDKSRTELELELVKTAQNQVTFLRAEIEAMRDEFVRDREEKARILAAVRLENAELSQELERARAAFITSAPQQSYLEDR